MPPAGLVFACRSRSIPCTRQARPCTTPFRGSRPFPPSWAARLGARAAP
jgi:hypothetical protein